jgi:glyoxylase-like metal-dependent hydrolase (beta-lactamase superfamily II)
LLNLGVPLASLDTIWLTQAHADHSGGVSTRPGNCPAIFVSARKGP